MKKRLFNTISYTFPAFLLIGLLIGPGCHSPTEKGAAAVPKDPIPATQGELSKGSIQRWIDLTASLEPLQSTVLYATVPGVLKEILVDRGSSVQKGDLIATIDVPDWNANWAQKKVEAEVAKREWERYQKAKEKAPDFVSDLTLEAALGKHEMAQADLKKIETLLEQTKIIAPFSGVVHQRWADVGTMVANQGGKLNPSGSAIVTLMDTSRLRLKIPVPESEAIRIRKGLPIQIFAEGNSVPLMTVELERFSESLDASTRTLWVESFVADPEKRLKAGMYVRSKIGIEKRENVLLVPTAALLFEKAKGSLFVIEQGMLKKKAIQMGVSNADFTEVITGVEMGVPIAIPLKTPLSDGFPVTIQSAQK